MEMEIFYAFSYTKPEKITQKLSQFMLYLAVSGFDYMRIYDGKRRLISLPEAFPRKNRTDFPPFLALFPPGVSLEFSANAKRENWAVLLSLPDVAVNRENFEYTFEASLMRPLLLPDAGKLSRLRESFSDVTECMAPGHSAGLTRAKLLCGSILAELLSMPAGDEVSPEKNTPETALKQAMDRDLHFEYSIGELNRRLGFCSLPHMRKRFLARYGMLPCKYRNNLRMNRILELFSQSDLSLKMIADEVGMRHLEHLYTFLQARQNLSPKDLMNQLRGKKISPEDQGEIYKDPV